MFGRSTINPTPYIKYVECIVKKNISCPLISTSSSLIVYKIYISWSYLSMFKDFHTLEPLATLHSLLLLTKAVFT